MKIRLGLCCKFLKENIKFREIRYIHYQKLSAHEQVMKLDEVILSNLKALKEALEFCVAHSIFSFRIGSSLLPLYTHPDCNFELEALPHGEEIFSLFHEAKAFAQKKNLRLSFHPDQFVILNSPNPIVVANAIRDLEYHNYLAELLGADVINIHAGGIYGDKTSALLRLENNILSLSDSIKSRLTLENDDKCYTPSDLMPLCLRTKIPLIYDVHHHRCLSDELSEEEATQKALSTWNREPYFHLSSPKEGWEGPKPSRHHDYIDPQDFPKCWQNIGPITIDIEAKAKELAVIQLMADLNDLILR